MKSERQAIIGQKIIWGVISNSDLQEGKDAAVIVGNYRTETEANLAAEGKGGSFRNQGRSSLRRTLGSRKY